MYGRISKGLLTPAAAAALIAAALAGCSASPLAGDTPPAPTGVMAAAVAGGGVSLSWTAPDSTPPVTAYLVGSNPAGASLSTAGTNALVTSGLVIGTTYTFAVQAINKAGHGGTGVSSAVVVGDVPGAPAAVGVTHRGLQPTVTWTAAPANGYAIRGYTVFSAPAGLSGATADGATTTLTFPPQAASQSVAYTFSVQAANELGSGPAGASASTVLTCTPAQHLGILPAGVDDSITVEYGTDLGDHSGTDALEAAQGTVDTTGWVKFSLGGHVPSWAVVTDLKLTAIPIGGTSGTPTVVIQYSADDDWSRDQNPKAAEIARGPVVSPAMTPGTSQNAETFTLRLTAHDFNQDVAEDGQRITLGVTTTTAADITYFGAASGDLAPFIDVTDCE
jgi:hypothetical protein